MGLTNNDILKKLRVAHKLRTEDMVKIIGLSGYEVNKGQLNDLFRKEDHPSFVPCGDQIVRKFLDGLIIHLRGPMPEKKATVERKEKLEKKKVVDSDKPPKKVIRLEASERPKKKVIKKNQRN